MYRFVAVFLAFGIAGATLWGVGARQVSAHEYDDLAVFDVRVIVDGSAITFTPADDGSWTATYDLGNQSSDLFYVVEAGVGPSIKDLPASDYCFSVALVDGRIVMGSVRGTLWTALSYTCAQEGPCEFIVSERGVNVER